MDYSDIIDLPHPVSRTHQQMSMHGRAAQFAPFAALNGHGSAIEETGRETEEWVDTTESENDVMDRSMMQIIATANEHPLLSIRYFIPDARKDGGRYVNVEGRLEKLRLYEKELVMEDGTIIPIKLIHDIKI